MTDIDEKELLRPVKWDNEVNCLLLLDQRNLPQQESWLRIYTLEELIEAIKTLAVRGAPLLGVVSAYGVYLGVRNFDGTKEAFLQRLEDVIQQISSTRPTAVNLFSALRRAQEIPFEHPELGPKEIAECIKKLGDTIANEEEQKSLRIAENGARLIPENCRILTHCNTGALATGGVGTALGIIWKAAREGKIAEVLVDETRPLLQGARLTSWELIRWQIKHRIICDSSSAWAMERGMVDMVIVGADRIARNGDVANKIGTYSLAVNAQKHRIPFVVAAPLSSFDISVIEGKDITIEERDPNEVLSFGNYRSSPERAKAWNPAFDITPAPLIWAIVTEQGVIPSPDTEKIVGHISGHPELYDEAVY